jgi:hypothetical protein
MNENTEQIATDSVVTDADVAPDASASSANKWYSLNSRKTKIAAGVGAGLLSFGIGFGASSLFTGDGHDGGRHDRPEMGQGMDWHHGPMMGGGHHGDMKRGGPQQWGQPGPHFGQMPSMGPDSGGQSWSNGS